MPGREEFLRIGAVYLPLLLAAALVVWHRVRTARAVGALALSALTVAAGLAAVHPMATRLGWWEYHASEGTVSGFPLDLWLGWVLLWGVAGPLLTIPARADGDRPRLGGIRLGLLLVADLLLMPLLHPVVVLGDAWLVGELVSLSLVALPALAVHDWTRDRRRLTGRVLIQMVVFGLLTLYAVPTLLFSLSGPWPEPAELATHPVRGVLATIAAAPAGLIALWSVIVFARDGGGTPFPLDPPQRLVTSGPYRWIANPMQTSMTVVVCAWALLLGRPVVLWLAFGGLVLSEGVARWEEGTIVARRLGRPWADYRARTPRWLPRRVHPATVVREPCPPVAATAGGLLADIAHDSGLPVGARTPGSSPTDAGGQQSRRTNGWVGTDPGSNPATRSLAFTD